MYNKTGREEYWNACPSSEIAAHLWVLSFTSKGQTSTDGPSVEILIEIQITRFDLRLPCGFFEYYSWGGLAVPSECSTQRREMPLQNFTLDKRFQEGWPRFGMIDKQFLTTSHVVIVVLRISQLLLFLFLVLFRFSIFWINDAISVLSINMPYSRNRLAILKVEM